MTKVIHQPDQDKKCPHFDQIRLVATFHVAAKGPVWARSLIRKVLGNEEYCMQVDAHTSFIEHWDTAAKSEWKMTQNEYAVISHPPALKSEQAEYESGGAKALQVPRACRVVFKSDNGYPDFGYPAHAFAESLDKPLLGYAWSSAFSFAKCHLEESAPYDSFSWYAKPVEQFSRFTRFWTRGYVPILSLLPYIDLGCCSSNLYLPDTMYTLQHEPLPFTITAHKQMDTVPTNGSNDRNSDFVSKQLIVPRLLCISSYRMGRILVIRR